MESFESKVADLKAGDDFARGFEHADGSFTAILRDFDPEHANPRENDGNVASLVMESRDYRDLDDSDSGIDEARDRWDIGHARYDERTYTVNGEELVVRYDRAAMVSRYLSIFRPDIVAYEDEWQVQSYNEVANGYAYATRDAWNAAFPDVDPATGYVYTDPDCGEVTTITPADCIRQEVEVYELYFSGEVYGFVHVEPDGEIVTTDVDGEHAECRHCGRDIETDSDGRWIDPEATGDDSVWRETCDENHEDRIAAHEPTRTLQEEVYTDGNGNVTVRLTDDSCWGFLGYEKLEDIAAEATDSPITDTVWS